jgi:diguanylate cyclase (GGDEF)-like protein/PAS domain S-box-containing protein
MRQREQQMRRVFLAVLLVLVGGMLAISAYTLWRLRADAISRGLELSAMHSRGFEDMLTQNLHATALVTANTLADVRSLSDPQQLNRIFRATLRQTPFLRSLSLLDGRGQIVASSNPANVGVAVPTEAFLPPASTQLEILRIGKPWAGRDFADGTPAGDATPVGPNGLSLIPVTLQLLAENRVVTLLATLNPDYFVNHFAQNLKPAEGTVDVLRYDGTLLMTTDPTGRPGSLHADTISSLRLTEIEFGQFEQFAADRPVLTAFRASRLYPVVVITRFDRNFALSHWQTEAITLVCVVVPVLLAVTLLAFAFYRRQMQLAAQRTESERLQRINAIVFEFSSEATLITDLNALIISVNPAFTQVTGFAPDEVINRHLIELLTPEGIDTFNEKLPHHPGGHQGGPANGPLAIEVQLRGKDGQLIWMEILSTPENDARGKRIGYRRIGRNITERKEMQDQVRQLAFHDPLTRLPNRRLLNDRLRQALAGSKRSNCYGALLFLDLDNFKPLNDTYGHAAGDALLIEAAERLHGCVREMDTVARFGGDEFVVVLSTLSPDRAESVREALGVAEKIGTALSRPYRLTVAADGKEPVSFEHSCTTSIGVSLFVDHQPNQEDVLKQADSAMYRAKIDGRNLIRFHEQEACRSA